MADEIDEGEGTEEGGGGSKKKLAIVGLIALVVGGGAGFGVATFLGGSGGEEVVAEADEDGDTEGDEPQAKKNERAIVALDDFTINLRGTGGGRVLRLEVSTEIDADDESTVLEKRPMMRDAILTLASDYTYNDLEGIDGKMRLRDELLARLNTSLDGDARVRRVYFTEFVVQ